MQHLQRFLAAERGATMVEYALLLSLIAIAILLSMDSVTEAMARTFDCIAVKIGGGTCT